MCWLNTRCLRPLGSRPHQQQQDAFRMTFEPAQTYHRDQEKVRGRDLLEVFGVSVSEPFNVNQSQHHCARGDTCFPKQVNKQIKTFHCGAPYGWLDILEATQTTPTWKHVQRISCGVYGWGSAQTFERIQLQCLQEKNLQPSTDSLSQLEPSVHQGGQRSPVTGQERASRDTSWSRP